MTSHTSKSFWSPTNFENQTTNSLINYQTYKTPKPHPQHIKHLKNIKPYQAHQSRNLSKRIKHIKHLENFKPHQIHQHVKTTSEPSKHLRTSENIKISKHAKTHQNHNLSKHIRTHQNTSKHIKNTSRIPQNTSEHIKTHQTRQTHQKHFLQTESACDLFVDIMGYFWINRHKLIWKNPSRTQQNSSEHIKTQQNTPSKPFTHVYGRFRDGRPIDFYALCLFSDIIQPQIMELLPDKGKRFFLPTIELSIHFHRIPSSDCFSSQCSTRFA